MHIASRYYYYHAAGEASLESATVTQSTGATGPVINILDLTFSRAVDITTDGWTIESDGDSITVSSVSSGSGTTQPRLVLSRDIVPGESLTVSYDPSTGSTETPSGRALAAITDMVITNSVILQLSEDFTGAVVDATKGAITNPSVANLSVTQNGRLIVTRVTDVNDSVENYWQSADSFTRGVFTVLVDREVGFAATAWFFRYYIDSSNFISIQGVASGAIRLAIQKSGASLEYDVNPVASLTSASIRVQIRYNASNEISFWYYNTKAWVQMGTTQTQDIGASGKIRLGSSSNSVDAAADRFSFDELRVTTTSYSTEFPETRAGFVDIDGNGLLSYDGWTKLSAFKTVDPFYTFSVLKNTDGKFYFTAAGKESKWRDPFVYKYNPSTNSIEQEHRIEMNVNTWDTHRSPVINCDSDGNIFIVAEQQQDTIDSHATPVNVYKTATPGDLSTLTLMATIDDRLAYPLIHVDGDNVFVTGRGTTDSTFVRGDYWGYKSTDGGDTFNSGNKIYDSGDEQKVAYFQRIHAYNGDMYLVLNERDNDLSNWTFISVIKSTDGGTTWTNLAGTFSRAITSSHITRAEMLSDCLVLESSDTENIAVCFEGGIVKSDGSVKIAISVQSLTGNTYIGNPEVEYDELRFYTYSAGWSFNSVTIPTGLSSYWAFERPFQYLNNDAAYDDIVLVDFSDNHNVYLLRSNDDFATQTDTLIVAGNEKYMMGEGAFNGTSEDDYFIVLCNPQGDIFETQHEGVEDFSDLLLVYVPNL